MTTANVETRLSALEQKVASLQKLLEHRQIAARIRRGLDQADRGQTIPARQALEAIRKKYKIQAP